MEMNFSDYKFHGHSVKDPANRQGPVYIDGPAPIISGGGLVPDFNQNAAADPNLIEIPPPILTDLNGELVPSTQDNLFKYGLIAGGALLILLVLLKI